MAESLLKERNYIVIQSFMVKDFNLKGNELLVYAIIYGFSQTEEQWFTGSLQYIADWTNCTKRGIINIINKLLEEKLIIKNEHFIHGIKFVNYRANYFIGSEKFSLVCEKNSPNNINNNIVKEKESIINNTKEKEIHQENVDLFYSFSNNVQKAITTWMEYKKERRESYKERGLNAFLKELKKNLDILGENMIIESINNCIARNYAGLFYNKPLTFGEQPKTKEQLLKEEYVRKLKEELGEDD